MFVELRFYAVNTVDKIVRQTFPSDQTFSRLELKLQSYHLYIHFSVDIMVRDDLKRNVKFTSGPVHTNGFSFENAYFFIRFRLPSTLIRSKTEVHVCENGGFRKRSLEWSFLKTEVQRLCVDGRKRRFSKTITSLALACPS